MYIRQEKKRLSKQKKIMDRKKEWTVRTTPNQMRLVNKKKFNRKSIGHENSLDQQIYFLDIRSTKPKPWCVRVSTGSLGRAWTRICIHATASHAHRRKHHSTIHSHHKFTHAPQSAASPNQSELLDWIIMPPSTRMHPNRSHVCMPRFDHDCFVCSWNTCVWLGSRYKRQIKAVLSL